MEWEDATVENAPVLADVLIASGLYLLPADYFLGPEISQNILFSANCSIIRLI